MPRSDQLAQDNMLLRVLAKEVRRLLGDTTGRDERQAELEALGLAVRPLREALEDCEDSLTTPLLAPPR